MMEKMQLWLIKSRLEVDYDCYNGFVIRAETEIAARQIASRKACREGAVFWIDSRKSTCSVLEITGEAQVILSDFLSVV